LPWGLANGRNSRAAISGATPGPLSVTVTHTFPPVSSVNESTNRRRGGFTVRSASSALLKRLTTTCSSRLASPITVGSSGSSLPSIEISSMVKRYDRSEEHTSELQSQSKLVCRLLLEKKKL